MIENNLNAKLEVDIKRFLEVYRVLPADGRAAFEAQMQAAVAKIDEKSKKLYFSLLQSAKEGMTLEEAIARMKKVS